MARYWTPIKWVGGIVLIAIVVGLIVPSLTAGISDERVRNGVLLQAIPFVAFFVAVLLTYILCIVLLAMRFNGRIPLRTHRPIETVAIVGILCGVIALFQPFHYVGYKYGFLMLLACILFFIVWSHIVAPRARANLGEPPLTPVHHAIGAAAGILVVFVLVSSITTLNAPVPPYGESQRLYNRMDETEQAEVAAAAIADFSGVEVPFLLVFMSIPGLIFYFAAREIAASALGSRAEMPVPVKATAT